MQTTLKSSFSVEGIGLHSGRAVCVTVRPAAAEMGIWFKRTDVVAGDPYIAARWDQAISAQLCTKLANEDGVSVSTVEHLMAALAGTGVHNAVIEVSGPELPIVDGSAAPFVEAIMAVGLQELDAPVQAIRVLRTVEVRDGEASACLSPANDVSMRFEIDFSDKAIGHQIRDLKLANGAFVRELCDSRTFCRSADIEAMQSQGLALGGTVEDAVVVDGSDVLTPGGLRHSDEPVRHKMLDAVGDLALAGGPVIGRYEGVRAGHAMTNRLLRALFADPRNYEFVPCTRAMAAKLPGAGLNASDLRFVA